MGFDCRVLVQCHTQPYSDLLPAGCPLRLDDYPRVSQPTKQVCQKAASSVTPMLHTAAQNRTASKESEQLMAVVMDGNRQYTVVLTDHLDGRHANEAYPMADWLRSPGTLAHFVECFEDWGAWGLELDVDDESDAVIAVVTDPAGRDLDVRFTPVQ